MNELSVDKTDDYDPSGYKYRDELSNFIPSIHRSTSNGSEKTIRPTDETKIVNNLIPSTTVNKQQQQPQSYIERSVAALTEPILTLSRKSNLTATNMVQDALKDASQIYVNTLDRVSQKFDDEPVESKGDYRNKTGSNFGTLSNGQTPTGNTLSKLNLQTFVAPANRISQLDESKENNRNGYLKPENNGITLADNRPRDGTLSSNSVVDNDEDEDDESESTPDANSYGISHLVKASGPNKEISKN